MYPGSMLVQTYPGGPIVAAVPVPMPVQTIDWYGGANGARAGSSGDGTNGGEVGYYYALGYPAGSEVGSSQLPETSSSTRRNSLESYQVRIMFSPNFYFQTLKRKTTPIKIGRNSNGRNCTS